MNDRPVEMHEQASPSAEILAPHKLASVLGLWHVECPCGAACTTERDGILGAHFPRMLPGEPMRVTDPFRYPEGSSVCRYSGRTVTLAAAIRRDEQLDPAERKIRNRCRQWCRDMAASSAVVEGPSAPAAAQSAWQQDDLFAAVA
jgi:hypothetical protein